MKSSKLITMTVIAAALAAAAFTACSAGSDAQLPIEETTPQTSETQGQEGSETMGEQTASATAPLLYEQENTAAGRDGAAGGDIGIEKIKAIALAKVPGATEADIYELEQEYDDGRVEYEGSIYYNGYEYEFEIDGATGNILQWEIDD